MNYISAPAVYMNKLKSNNPPPDVRKAVDPRIKIILVADPWQHPKKWDYYVTRAGLSAKTERKAAELGALVIVMSEGAEYLAGKVSENARLGLDTWVFQPYGTGDIPPNKWSRSHE